MTDEELNKIREYLDFRMLADLGQYLERRNKGFITDDKCDYEVWENLYNWLSEMEVEE